MSKFGVIVAELRKQERQLAVQLESIRTAIASLEFGSSGVPAPAIIETPHAAGRQPRARRKMSAAQRRTISLRMKKYWAARRKNK
jgi:hypothetical protein